MKIVYNLYENNLVYMFIWFHFWRS